MQRAQLIMNQLCADTILINECGCLYKSYWRSYRLNVREFAVSYNKNSKINPTFT